MNQLPIVVLDKSLKYSLGAQKVKTLEKAIEYTEKLNVDDPKRHKIQLLKEKYANLNDIVAKQFNGLIQTQSINIDLPKQLKKVEEIYQFLQQSSVCEISGGKGSGKTCLLLHFVEQFLKINEHLHNNTKLVVRIFNCVGGITQHRLTGIQKSNQKIKNLNFEFCDVNNMQQIEKSLLKILVQLKNNEQFHKQKCIPHKLCLAIDGMANFILSKQSTKNTVVSLFKTLSKLSSIKGVECSIIYTNFVQSKYQLGHEQIYNHSTYFCQTTSQYLTHKYYTERIQKKQHKKNTTKQQYSHRIISIKSSAIFSYRFLIQLTGVTRIVAQGYRLMDLKSAINQQQSRLNRQQNQQGIQQEQQKYRKPTKPIVNTRIVINSKNQQFLSESSIEQADNGPSKQQNLIANNNDSHHYQINKNKKQDNSDREIRQQIKQLKQIQQFEEQYEDNNNNIKKQQYNNHYNNYKKQEQQ